MMIQARRRPLRHHLTGRLLGIGLILLALVGCGTGEGPAGAGRPLVVDGYSVLRKGNGAEPQTLDPHRAEDVSSSNILRDLYEGLMLTGPDGSPIPGAAERHELSEDGTVYSFHLRPQARWSNGDPVVAADFVAGMRRSVDPATGSNYGMILAPILNAEAVLAGTQPPEALGVEALGPLQLRITLKAPTPYFLSLLTHSTTYPIHRPSLAEYGAGFSRPGRMVSNGAYQLAEAVVQSHVTLVRNPHYRQAEQVAIDEVRYYAIDDAASEIKRYRAGELDWTASVASAQYGWIAEHLADELKVHPYLGVYYFGYNLTRPPFQDNLALREALSLAIDREILTERITATGELVAYGWVPPGLDDYRAARLPWADWSRERRFERARELYAAAGYGPERPLQVEISYNTSEDHRKIAVAVAQMWKQVLGVGVTLRNEEWKVFLQSRKQKQTEVFRAGWIGDYTDPYTFLELMHSGHGINDSGYANPAYDALLARIAAYPAGETRNALMQEAERMMLADHVVIPLYFYVSKKLVKPWVAGYRPNIMDHHYTKDLGILAPVATLDRMTDAPAT